MWSRSWLTTRGLAGRPPPGLVRHGLSGGATGSMLCWRRVEQRVDQLEYLGRGGRVSGGAGEPVAVGAAGGRQGEGVQVAGGLLVGRAEAESAELDGGDSIGWGRPDRSSGLAIGQ